jgi:hypothetical protein
MADETKTPVFEDIEFSDAPTKVYPTIKGGTYDAIFIGFETVEKPQYKIDKELLDHPDEEPDPHMYRWTFRITEVVELHDTDADGNDVTRMVTNHEISDRCNRKWHERSTAGKWAAGIAGIDKYEPAKMRAAGFTSTKAMYNRPCRIIVTEVKSQRTGGWFNYIKGVESATAGRGGGRGTGRASAPVVEGGLGLDEEDF